MGLLYCLGVGCGFVGRVLVWPGGRRGCSEVGGETLVALQVGKGVKLAPLRKVCKHCDYVLVRYLLLIQL